MDTKEKIVPHKITKPIQLLAAWLTGLIVVNATFLTAATQLTQVSWLPPTLVIASIVNVPLFLLSIFLLQTKFRPEMQEDSFYSKYLESKTGYTEREINVESVSKLREEVHYLQTFVSDKLPLEKEQRVILKSKWSSVTISLNKSLRNYSEIALTLADKKIPIHENFGTGAGDPMPPFKVAIGSGFSVEQIKDIVISLSEVTEGWISYANDDDKINEYDYRVLIGSYGSYNHGIEFKKLIPLFEHDELKEVDLYKVLGK